MSGPVEPTAGIRVLASNLFQIFVALTAEGFTEAQALVIIGQMLAANAARGEQP